MADIHELKPAMPRLDGVDVLRGWSILAVVLLHVWIRFSFVAVHLGADWPPLLRHLVFSNGGNGVTVFFAVSGFLITLTSLKRFGSLATMRAATFYRIRFARIFPMLLLLLAVLSGLHLAHVDDFGLNGKFFTLPRALFAALTFHLNWLEASRDAWLPPCWTVLWSLSIEETFYLFFPLVSLSLWRLGRWGVVLWSGIGLGLFAVGPWARVVWPKTDLQAENSYLAGMASIALGCLSAALVSHLRGQRVSRRVSVTLEGAGWGLIALIALWPPWPMLRVLGSSGTDDSLLALATCLVMAGVALRGRKGGAVSAPVRWFGRHSYEVYLSHEFVVLAGVGLYTRYFASGASRATLASFVMGMVLLTAPLAWALAKWFSEPMNRRLRGSRMAK